jgi:hypothetical protein
VRAELLRIESDARGTRCAILIQLPVAFCGQRSANADPVPAPKPAIVP